jgi:methionyl-tRNA synthetase
MAQKHKDIWDGLNISYTNFIRTTSSAHVDFVQSVLKKVYENGMNDIYQ